MGGNIENTVAIVVPFIGSLIWIFVVYTIFSRFFKFFQKVSGVKSFKGNLPDFIKSGFATSLSRSSEVNKLSPEILKMQLNQNSPKYQQMLQETAKIRKTKEIKKVDDFTNDLLSIYQDDSEHWYRIGYDKNGLIVTFVRYS